MQVKYDEHSKNYLLLMRQIQMKSNQKEKFEWVPLTNANKNNHVNADYYRGFVSLEYLKTLDNTFSTGVKLRSKHLTFMSHEQSLL